MKKILMFMGLFAGFGLAQATVPTVECPIVWGSKGDVYATSGPQNDKYPTTFFKNPNESRDSMTTATFKGYILVDGVGYAAQGQLKFNPPVKISLPLTYARNIALKYRDGGLKPTISDDNDFYTCEYNLGTGQHGEPEILKLTTVQRVQQRRDATPLPHRSELSTGTIEARIVSDVPRYSAVPRCTRKGMTRKECSSYAGTIYIKADQLKPHKRGYFVMKGELPVTDSTAKITSSGSYPLMRYKKVK